MATREQAWKPDSALDYCTMLGARQNRQDDVLAVALEDQDMSTLNDILRDYRQNGASASLNERARQFLIVYREREKWAQVLDPEERRQLDVIISRPTTSPTYNRPTQSRPTTQPRFPSNYPDRTRRFIIGGVIAAVLALGGLGFAYLWDPGNGTPPAGTVQQHPPAQQVAPGTTNLQDFKQDYGPFNQVTPSDAKPQTGQPALLLLEDGGYFVSQGWKVSPTADGWQQDLSGDVTNVDVKGDHIDITDSDSNPYIVGTDQAFVVSSNPGTVVRIDSTGKVFSMSLAKATAVRQSVK